jgi:hypothetical protein
MRSITIGHRRHRGYAPPSLAQAAPAGLDLDQTPHIHSYCCDVITDPLVFSISSAMIGLGAAARRCHLWRD